MAGERTELRLEPGLGLRVLPLPLLFARLALLASPAADLPQALEERSAANPLLSVEPPHVVQPQGTVNGREDDEDHWADIPALPSLEEAIGPQLALVEETALLGEGADGKLLSCLDTRGYLTAPAGELAAEIGVEAETLEQVLEEVRAVIDPPGLFARDLLHCLLLQLSRQGLGDSDAAILLARGREDLERQDMASLRKRLGWDRERLERALAVLRRLDPHPGRGFAHPGTILPEVALRYDDRGSLSVKLLVDHLPRLLLDAGLLASAGEGAQKAFREARGTLSALAARYRTKLRLALLLGSRQRAFLQGTEAAPRPLTLSEAGRELGLAPSTVQRAAASTWASTPRGTILLSSLTGRSLSARPDLSARALREAIRAGWKAGLCDAALGRDLGVPARTVTWHRQKLGLPRTGRA
jgi:RNA polymerase sigma-54 factor